MAVATSAGVGVSVYRAMVTPLRSTGTPPVEAGLALVPMARLVAAIHP